MASPIRVIKDRDSADMGSKLALPFLTEAIMVRYDP
jgi:hypothetical protein